MKRKIFLLAAAFLIMLSMAFMAYADGIGRADDVDSFYSDHKAYKVGDIVTVLVVESTEGYQEASLKTSKSQTIGGGLGMSAWGGGVTNPYPGSVPNFGAGGKVTQDGGGKSVRSGGLMGEISVRVQKVLSSGNLVIKGSKTVKINDDKQNLIVQGVIRVEDISAANTIKSTYVANANIEYEGKGPIGEKTSPGIITRLLDWLGIF